MLHHITCDTALNLSNFQVAQKLLKKFYKTILYERSNQKSNVSRHYDFLE
jgi:hypothetical protein